MFLWLVIDARGSCVAILPASVAHNSEYFMIVRLVLLLMSTTSDPPRAGTLA